jgi:hypothetical protein
MPLSKKDYINRVNDMSSHDIALGIRENIVTFAELQETGEFTAIKQREVKKVLESWQQEDVDYDAAATSEDLEAFLVKYPNSLRRSNVEARLDAILQNIESEQRSKLEDYKRDSNKVPADSAIKTLGEKNVRMLCDHYGLDFDVVANFEYPQLIFNEIPKSKDDIPEGYTDVFFWGIPSSGKSCALAAILSTMKEEYSIVSPEKMKFGSSYRDSLTNIFRDNIGYLPARTARDRTQYMPFYFKERGKEHHKKMSFFELSGEVFELFWEKESGVEILNPESKQDAEEAFKTVELLLSCSNPKIHFFFIDYSTETEKGAKHGLTQDNFLTAATNYFRNNHGVLSRNTKAIITVITKADTISGVNEEERKMVAEEFLKSKFGNFYYFIEDVCKKNNIKRGNLLFSIGDVYFKRICRIDRSYSQKFIRKIIELVNDNKDTFLSRIFNFFRQ